MWINVGGNKDIQELVMAHALNQGYKIHDHLVTADYIREDINQWVLHDDKKIGYNREIYNNSNEISIVEFLSQKVRKELKLNDRVFYIEDNNLVIEGVSSCCVDDVIEFIDNILDLTLNDEIIEEFKLGCQTFSREDLDEIKAFIV